MPSPFPGMDPYVESPSFWGDFHVSMIVTIRSALNNILPDAYVAEADQFVWLDAPERKKKKMIGKPDSFVIGGDLPTVKEHAGTMTIDAPEYTTLPVKRKKGNRYVKVIDRESQRVVTVIELLSPSNKKRGKDREAYIVKRNDCLAAGINLIEIDLLRSGDRMPMGMYQDRDYCILVCSANEFPKSGVWTISARDELPKIPVPLDAGVEPVFLLLRDCFDHVYDDGRYGHRIDYAKPPKPPLKKSDAAWARKILKQKKIIVE